MAASNQEELGVVLGAFFASGEDRADSRGVDEREPTEIELDLERTSRAETSDCSFQAWRTHDVEITRDDEPISLIRVHVPDVERLACQCLVHTTYRGGTARSPMHRELARCLGFVAQRHVVQQAAALQDLADGRTG